MKCLNPKFEKREKGQTMLETAMLLPWLFLFIFGIVEITLYLFTKNIVNYAAYMAARSAVVFSNQTLGNINYPYTGGSDSTPKSQKIAEAAAEKIIFESLPWENKRIRELNSENAAQRVYQDIPGSTGAVRIESLDIKDNTVKLKLLYCMPLHFNLHKYFIPEKFSYDCKNVFAPTGTYDGLPVIEEIELKIKG